MDNINLLKRLGFTEYDAKIYLALAKVGPCGVKELVVESHVPRNKVYESLDSLEKDNKILTLPISPKQFKISNPESLTREVNDLQSSVKDFIKVISQPKVSEFKDFFWVLKGKKAIEEKLVEQSDKSVSEIVGCNTFSKILHSNIRSLKDSVDRGISVKFLSTFEKKRIPIYKKYLETGIKIRVFDTTIFGPLIPRINVFDGSVARLTIGAPEVQREEDYLTLWTESKAFAQMLKNHFMTMWKKAKPIESYF